jgi:DNA-binding transcriptional LysR family regulator
VSAERFNALTLQQLRVFSAAAREGSFARAADSLSLSEPNVSTHIQTLERSVGVVLFERSRGRRQILLTEAGRALLATTTDVFAALERGAIALEVLRDDQRTTLRVGVGVYFAGYVMPRVQDRLRQIHPNIALRVEVFSEPHTAAERVVEGHLDLLLTGERLKRSDLSIEPFFGFDCVLVGPPGHRLADGIRTPFGALAAEVFVVRVRSAPSWQALEHLAERRGIGLRVALDSADMDSEVQAVSSGVGLAVIPWEAATPRIVSGQIVVLDVEGLPIHAQRYMVHRRGLQSPSLLAFKQVLRESQDIMRSGLVPPAGSLA